MSFESMRITELVDGIKTGRFTSEEVCRYFIDRCERYSDLNAIIEVYSDVLDRAKVVDAKIKSGAKTGKLAGIPVVIKDNILYKGKKMTCASKFLQDFVSPYTATIVDRLEKEDAIIFGRANMDEFAMGGSCEKSCYGPCKNAHDSTRVSGGSSGGSAVAVAAGLCPIAIGTDTGGSVRQPSSFNGVVGIKPTYGTVSRYGITAFASSTDQAAPITRDIRDNELVLDIISGRDIHDGTSIDDTYKKGYTKEKYTIGIVKELKDKIKSLSTSKVFESAIERLRDMGHDIIEVSVPHILD